LSYSGKRILDLTLAMVILAITAVPMLIIGVLVKFSSRGPVFYWSDRVGHNNKIFRMPKFRTMRLGTPVVATHILDAPEVYLSPIGGFLRKTSIDELPQMWSILIGHMSMVGPRPALFNQDDLIELRAETGVSRLVPGLTGLAQINGRDELPLPQKVKFDVEYMKNISLFTDLKILGRTFSNVFIGDGVSH